MSSVGKGSTKVRRKEDDDDCEEEEGCLICIVYVCTYCAIRPEKKPRRDDGSSQADGSDHEGFDGDGDDSQSATEGEIRRAGMYVALSLVDHLRLIRC